jgi:nucleotide-binding universal stress UspA family protein
MAAERSALVGVDGSLSARLALEHAAQRVGPDGRLVLVHVLKPQTTVVTSAVVDLEPERHRVARELVEQLAGEVGVETAIEVVDGSPSERLAALARTHDVDEIVVGSRGLGRFAAPLGSVSHAVLQEADRPVVVVPRAASDRPRGMRAPGSCVVIVGYDGSEPARAALAYAAQRASPHGRVVAVHAAQPTPDWLGWPNYREVLEAHQGHGQQVLGELPDQRELGTALETSLLEGPPARAILAAADARDADEIVIGSRGLGAVRGVLGSVSHALLHETDRVVVVIPAG